MTLTEREKQIVSRLADGRTVKEIAAEIGRTTKCVEWHSIRARRKIGSRSIAGLVKFAVLHGLTDLIWTPGQ